MNPSSYNLRRATQDARQVWAAQLQILLTWLEKNGKLVRWITMPGMMTRFARSSSQSAWLYSVGSSSVLPTHLITLASTKMAPFSISPRESSKEAMQSTFYINHMALHARILVAKLPTNGPDMDFSLIWSSRSRAGLRRPSLAWLAVTSCRPWCCPNLQKSIFYCCI